MPQCKLCMTITDEIRNSHIIPESLYAPLYNDKKQIMGINDIGNRGWKPLQKGIREPLFCETCEQYFNEHFEKPFKANWTDVEPLKGQWGDEELRWIKVDYASFKLFHLSILFRASVSTLPIFSAVSLGSHEDVVRKLLLIKDSGPASKYPIFGYAVVHHKSREVVPLISQPERKNFNGHCVYGMVYGGAQWWVSVSSHLNREFEKCGLHTDGRMPFYAESWNELSIIQAASRALRRNAS